MSFNWKKQIMKYYIEYIGITEVRFASFLSGGFITAKVVNPPERKLAKRTSVQSIDTIKGQLIL